MQWALDNLVAKNPPLVQVGPFVRTLPLYRDDAFAGDEQHNLSIPYDLRDGSLFSNICLGSK
jgi:hypothetical protein